MRHVRRLKTWVYVYTNLYNNESDSKARALEKKIEQKTESHKKVFCPLILFIYSLLSLTVLQVYKRDSFRCHIFLYYLVSIQILNFISVPFEFYLCFWVNNIRFESSVYSTIILLFLFFALFLLLRAVTFSKNKNEQNKAITEQSKCS